MKNEYAHGFLQAGYGRPAFKRQTLLDRIKLRRRRRKQDDLAGARRWSL